MATTTPESTDISSEIQSVILTKNPIALFFGLSRLRTLFEDFADSLLSNIEKTYYQETTGTFISLIKEYERQGFYKIMTAYYYDIGYFQIQKAELDKYFEQSYWQDVDFYFFVLCKHQDICTKVTILHAIYQDGLDASYMIASTVDQRTTLLEGVATELGIDIRDISRMPVFTTFFNTLVPELARLRESGLYDGSKRWGASCQKFIKEVYMLSLAESNPVMIDFWRTYFVEDSAVNRNLIEALDDREVLDCFAYLRNKLLANTKYNLSLSDSSRYHRIIDDCIQMQKGDVSQKMNFLGSIHASMGTRASYREQFQNVIRKGLLYQNSIDLVDAILGITFLKRVVFYEVRRRMVGVDTTQYRFESLDEVNTLVKMLESSFVLRFFRPFFIRRLAQVFNKRSELYYFIKFVLTIHSSTTYNEYQELSRFFVSLEAFEKKGWYGTVLRSIQFGWVYIVGALLVMVVPFGVFAAAIAYVVTRFIRRALKAKFPELVLTSNFQLGSFLALMAIVSFTFGATFGLKDNMSIVYNNYRNAINAGTLVTSETFKLVNTSVFKASSWEGGTAKDAGQGSDVFSRMDYLNGVDYQKAVKPSK